jgi:hypothetical protein
MPGRTVTRSDVDLALGNATAKLNSVMHELDQLRDDFFQPTSDTELEAMGYDLINEVPKLRDAISDMNQLVKIYRGQEALPVAQNFRANIRKLWGLGS